jgi:DNA mismatch repair protein PMS2
MYCLLFAQSYSHFVLLLGTSDAILCLGTQFQLVDVNASKPTLKSETIRLATSDSATTAKLETRCSSILGPKFLDGLTRIETDLSAAINDKKSGWKLYGLVSHSPASPNPSTARETQLFSINGRPVDLPNVSRLIGEVWKTYDSEGGRRPACLLAFTLPNHAFDVNLSPDKRQVLFTEETAMLGLIKEVLTKLWSEQSGGKFEANEVEKKSNRGVKGSVKDAVTMDGLDSKVAVAKNASNTASEKEEFNTITPRPRRKATNGDESRSDNDSLSAIGNKTVITPTITQTQQEDLKTAATHQHDATEVASATDAQENESSYQNDGNNVHWQHAKSSHKERKMWEQMKLNFNRVNMPGQQKEVEQLETEPRNAKANPDSEFIQKDNSTTPDKMPPTREAIAPKQNSKRDVESFIDSFAFRSSTTSTTTKSRGMEPGATEPVRDACQPSTRPKRKARDDASGLNNVACGSSKSVKRKPTADSDSEESSPDEQPVERSRRMVVGQRIISQKQIMQGRARAASTNENLIAAATTRGKERPSNTTRSEEANGCCPNLSRRSQRQSLRDDFREESNPLDVQFETVWSSFTGTANVIAQSQQSKVLMQKKREIFQTSMEIKNAGNSTNVDLDRNNFIHMSIIGQFNNGFILARCPNHNLWILDQHACDEKYNFEKLCKEMTIHEQRLITPLPLELSPSEEHCVLEHTDLFERNGFRFHYNPDKEPRHRVTITALPHSGSGGDGTKAVQFGKEGEVIFFALLNVL